MKHGSAAIIAAFMLAACRGTGNDANNSEGVSALTASNSAFTGGAVAGKAGNAVTNAGTGVTGGNGTATVSQMNGNSGAGRSGGGPQSSGPAPSAPGAR